MERDFGTSFETTESSIEITESSIDLETTFETSCKSFNIILYRYFVMKLCLEMQTQSFVRAHTHHMFWSDTLKFISNKINS